MRRLATALLGLTLALPLQAEWVFADFEAVSGTPQAKLFPHLESAGRGNLAAGGGQLALVWEDNRDGSPQVYAALRDLGRTGFSAPRRLSTGAEAYEPVVLGLGEGRFLAAFEQDGKVVMRVFSAAAQGPLATLDAAASAQPTLAAGKVGLHAVWGRRDGRFLRLVSAPLTVDGLKPHAGAARAVDTSPAQDEQLYASLVATAGGYALAWEDRRAGHTRLLTATSSDGRKWSEPQPLNEIPRSGTARELGLGRGPGVTRVCLAGDGADTVAAVWMDKRDFLSGYDIYAGVSTDGGAGFGANEKAQDVFGAEKPQWHPAVAVTPHGVVAAWDDPRDDSPDIWLAARAGGKDWSDDFTLDGARGTGSQDNPALLWHGGRLHLAWVHRDEQGGQVRYAQARWE
ncbi:MAG: hypothetical protein CVV05_16835 [Gammaproteobacteria bacterium HGW-Gammaproteobacteria-1]|nr:MAG: hypothetical protein CVV05_16835 [Gammaproteobacteria bacterium HGW-Gammaproteobacteria-1]